MLKSTHRVATTVLSSSKAVEPLPPNWTEHTAPTGHTYYYNSETKQSTYARPVSEPLQEDLVIDYGATQPDYTIQASIHALNEFHKNNSVHSGHTPQPQQERHRSRQGDRPKTKQPIPSCVPWILVKTKYGRRFVHNTETKESLWKFPSEVMMAVIELDRLEWQTKEKDQRRKEEEETRKAEAEAESAADRHGQGPKQSDTSGGPSRQDGQEAVYDSDEYEEVEVTDDEAEGDSTINPASKRPRIEDQPSISENARPPGPQEFDEDDIAYQLAQMEAEEADPVYDHEATFDDDQLAQDEEPGLELTDEDNTALFRSLLDDHNISPFETFDRLVDANTALANTLINDPRWTALPNMSTRRTTFTAWSRDRIAQRNAAITTTTTTNDNQTPSSSTTKPNPRITYLTFLSHTATPKLYWPEFKRRYRRDPILTDRHHGLPDRDREKLYREYVAKLKLDEKTRKREFVDLLRGVSEEEWAVSQSSGGVEGLPSRVREDIRFYGVREEKEREEMVALFSGTSR